jgi:hypothetical protein
VPLEITGRLSRAQLGRFGLARSVSIGQISVIFQNDMELSQADAVITKYVISSLFDNDMELSQAGVVARNFIAAAFDNNMELSISNATAFFRLAVTFNWNWALALAFYGILSAEVEDEQILGIIEPTNPAAYLESWRRDNSYTATFPRTKQKRKQ